MKSRLILSIVALVSASKLPAATLRTLCQIETGIVGGLVKDQIYGADGAFACTVSPISGSGQSHLIWVSSLGVKITDSVGINYCIAVSGKCVLASSSSSDGTVNNVVYFESNAGIVTQQSLGQIQASSLVTFGSSLQNPRFSSWNFATGTLTCFELDGSQFGAVAAANTLSSPLLGTNGFSVTANTGSISSITIQSSTNLNTWQNVITIEAPKPAQTVTVPIQGQSKLHLRLTGQ